MLGEAIAALYLQKSGYEIREKNVRFGKLEIDIVAYDRNQKMIVFVEVKTRSTHSSAYPVHSAVTGRKRRAMRKAVARWVTKHDYQGCGRIDVVSVSGGRIVEHIQNLGSDFI